MAGVGQEGSVRLYGQAQMSWEQSMSNILVLSLAVITHWQVAAGADPAEAYPPGERRAISPGNTIYTINPASGSDKQSGLKAALAWRTFAPVNRLVLAPGDRVEITAPGSFEQTLMLKGEGTEKAPISVKFAPGRYDFFPAKALRRKYQISNTNDDPANGKALGILLDGAKHVRISGPGARIVCRGKMIQVCIDGSEDIVLSDLQFDYHRPTVSEFRVAALGDGHVDLKIHKDSHYKIEDGRIIWKGEGWAYDTGLAQELDLETNEIWRRRDPLKGLAFEEISPFLVRGRGSHPMKPGRVYQLRDTFRDCAGVFTRRSRNITWWNVRFYFLHGMGLVNQFSENLTFDTVSIAPDEKSGRTCAAWADGIQASGCRGKLIVKDCIFSGTHDDAINIHGTYLRVVEQPSETRIKVRFMHKQTFGFMAFNPGDAIGFVAWDTMKTYGSNKVKSARLLNPKEMMLHLERPAPPLGEHDVVENVTWTPEAEIRGCTVARIPTRGFLLTTRRKVLVEGNTFLRTHMSAILLGCDAKSWFESGPVRDMAIRNNRFVMCAEPVIRIQPENSAANDAAHQNIRVLGNDFVLRGTTAIGAKSTKHLRITGNRIYSAKKAGDDLSILTNNCSDVLSDGNRYLPLSAWAGKTGKDE